MSFVIIQRLPSGEARLSSLLPLDYVTACLTHRALAPLYPGCRFEIVPCTRSVRRKLGELPVVQQPAPQKFAAGLAAKFGQFRGRDRSAEYYRKSLSRDPVPTREKA